MERLISDSEIETLLTCQARHDFKYGRQLAGTSLKEKMVQPLLSGGKAWGAAVATWHVHSGELDAGEQAMAAMDEKLDEDVERQREFGLYDEDAYVELRTELLSIMVHHFESHDPIPMDEVLERELLIPLPSRTGVRPSNRYKLLAYLDATEHDEEGGVWLDEFKLRTRLTAAEVIVNGRQVRRYAWAYQHVHDVEVRGVWVNERLRESPKPARILKGRGSKGPRPSHAKDQLCTAESYVAACQEHGEEPHEDVVEELAARRWWQRVPIQFRDGELEEAGAELVSAAQQIQQFDSGELYPIRHVTPGTCNRCQFKQICPAPDPDLVDALYERVLPKQDREPEERTETKPVLPY